ncbi:MAG: hypothetical protein IKM61_01205 [Eubacteriaceae bacterium]|nr:hypothetical protein [Eubacteriaceae bacterium]
MKRKKLSLEEEIIFKMDDPALSAGAIVGMIMMSGNINGRDRDGRTYLMNAISMSRTDIAYNLIKNGADVNLRDNDDFTAAHVCVMCLGKEDALKVMSWLKDHGADINAVDCFGNTPLMRINDVRKLSLAVELIKSFGADVSVKNNYGMSAKDLFGAYPEVMDVINAVESEEH